MKPKACCAYTPHSVFPHEHIDSAQIPGRTSYARVWKAWGTSGSYHARGRYAYESTPGHA